MAINWSKVSDTATLVAISIVIWALGWVSYGWSLGETEKLSVYIFADYAIYFSWIVQLGPQVFIVLGKLLWKRNRKMAITMYVLAVAFNLIDAVTNIGAFSMMVGAGFGGGLPAFVQGILKPLGYTCAFLVTWAEEVMILLVGQWVHVLGLIVPLPGFLMANTEAELTYNQPKPTNKPMRVKRKKVTRPPQPRPPVPQPQPEPELAAEAA